ncbi:MAG: enoyl-CoA hydratase-related protein [Thermoplasmata archaeon]|nr:enoyl-CoA hydratase-related protein [Thermoplasmata archaeon]
MKYEAISVERDGAVERVTLDRSATRNAFDDLMVSELSSAFEAAGSDPAVRAVVLTGAGDSFSAGADLRWMKRMASYTYEENVADAKAMASMFHAIAGCPRPVVGRINGPAVGGGAGLVAACDIAIASERARFRFSEVKLGLVPAVVSPYVIGRIGPAKARVLFITGEWLDAARAAEIGLVDTVVPHDLLDRAVADLMAEITSSGPVAAAEAKRLVADVAAGATDEHLADLIATLRASEEGQEGIGAFLGKRRPGWGE